MADNGALSTAPGDRPAVSLAVDPRAPGAYQWWYFDATSDDGALSLVVIVFVGSVFSPWYARRLARGERAEPREHCAVNVALYDRGRRAAWAFSEYPGFERGRDALRVGRSSVVRDRGGWSLSIDEREPWTGVVVRGRARFEPSFAIAPLEPLRLDERGLHRWAPVAPRCRASASLELAGRSYALSGTGYHDENHGDRPLAESFARWTWARSHEPSGRTVLVYDRAFRSGERRVLRVALDARDAVARDEPGRAALAFGRGGWGLEEPGAIATGDPFAGTLERLARVEGSPFYARFVGRTAGGGRAVAEQLDLDRFERAWVRALLPFRARRCPAP